ncbi:MAG: nucleoside-diphosphate sugar epimerase [Candidatus Omnitrophica bacterium CG11_big_fil_rev_8_21_14_0_20_45_26]|uniref:Nucleoside-diphosphate sugar epimerase n=1 Tax=Candidatus Abzuiibacterium crystallinum TaxID=1974748 RepID=A0A2H0LLJ4_9BACT|nr:MAG: nucleoside-diphosphate sugar epimerase [Candidatus Omnitrophica bacterium CG11_big_fil_rev_8_21_14_0_20_45_26]PIW64517.1 MAG: nucleoside-diphosphate sugar epimerase [Candidatus Omnitrophica bacterium CG12_big_fil_rev_8_21_14_0_65_45_16]
MKILVTGGGGFVGSHVCEYFSKKGAQVIAFDNLSRARLLKRKKASTRYNWNFLGALPRIQRVTGDINHRAGILKHMKGVQAVIHTAGQTAVTTSVTDPETDFMTNAVGTFHVLEAARSMKKPPMVLICSTNKVYGDRVNSIPLRKRADRYVFSDQYRQGVPEDFGTDLCKHTPYGCSKLTADLYAQDYARMYGMKVGVFRMSCIYGTRQFGVEDQGWLVWFIIAAVTKKPLTIYGDGRQVRDVLWVEDLVRAYEAFIHSRVPSGVYNMGGGARYTLSLLELIGMLKREGLSIQYQKAAWRPSDQKVYISNIQKAVKELSWKPLVSPVLGVRRLVQWVREHQGLFK